jgi:hypothetical protein
MQAVRQLYSPTIAENESQAASGAQLMEIWRQGKQKKDSATTMEMLLLEHRFP